MNESSNTTNRCQADIANILIEALPYIQRFHGTTVVIKYGGNAMIDDALKTSFARDVVMMKLVGINPVVVHGGGPQISQALDRMGKSTEFVDGLRVTDKETMDTVEMVLGGLVNNEIVSLINSQGGKAVGLSGKDGDMIRAEKIIITKAAVNDQPSEIIDIGHVGKVSSVDANVVDAMQSQGFIPVVAPLGVGEDGMTYNINADTVAGALASVLEAEKLVLMTNTPGVLDSSGNLLPGLNSSEIAKLIEDKVIVGGMLPKINCGLDAVNTGVKSAHIIDGRVDHALLLEIFTDTGVGTLISS
ncbi:MAG: acetylglutamate kinase [Proteobacteria bacterium]|jgi:acetylglutamate kinase|nr:acetylglutamate kinase [Pseudomonadota bacterium]